MTRPLIRSHLRSPDEMNWSISTWAPLAKSPNWASQSVRVFGSASEKPYSKPSTASSDSAESSTSKCAWPGRRLESGV